jgi:hypothetical protein
MEVGQSYRMQATATDDCPNSLRYEVLRTIDGVTASFRTRTYTIEASHVSVVSLSVSPSAPYTPEQDITLQCSAVDNHLTGATVHIRYQHESAPANDIVRAGSAFSNPRSEPFTIPALEGMYTIVQFESMVVARLNIRNG